MWQDYSKPKYLGDILERASHGISLPRMSARVAKIAAQNARDDRLVTPPDLTGQDWYYSNKSTSAGLCLRVVEGGVR